MDLSGVIFVVLAVAWAGYLIPKALKHHDEVARTRSVDRFSSAMRVLARREPVNRRDARLVVSPARSVDNPRMLVPASTGSGSARPVMRRTEPASNRRAARGAARRRRRILAFLVFATLVVTGLAAFAVVPWWSVSVPGGLTFLFLLLCRTQVRRARDASWEADLAASVAPEESLEETRRRAARLEAPAAAVRNAQGFEEIDAEDDTMAIPAVLDAVAVPTVDGGSLWDPLPVTLPTYVTKPKARRTVRTIDLNEPGTWTSGRSPEDSQLVSDSNAQQPATTDKSAADESGVEQQRAVGS